MDLDFADPSLESVYYDPKASLGHGPSLDKGFRKVIGIIRAAKNELDLRALKGLHYHKLQGDRSHQHALNITGNWRLIVQRIDQNGRTKLLVESVEDYH